MKIIARSKPNRSTVATAVLAAAFALFWVWAAGPAFGLTGALAESQPLSPDNFNAGGSGDSTTGFYLYKGPDAQTAAQRPGLLLSGTATSALLGGGSLDGSVFFSRTIMPRDPLSVSRSFAAQPASGLSALGSYGDGYVLRSGTALWQKLNFSGSKWSLTGSYAEVSKEFEGLSDVVAKRPDADKLRNLLGMKQTSMDFRFQPSAGLGLTSHYESSTNDQAGNKEQGLARSLQRYMLDWQMSAGTKLTATREISSQDWNRPDRKSSEEKAVSTFNLTQTLGHGLLASVTKQLTDATTNGTGSRLDATLAHLEYKPDSRMSLAADWGSKHLDSGSTERTTGLNLSTLLGQGKSALMLTGQWQQKVAGEGNAQRDQSLRLGLKMDKNPLLQFALNYESLRQEGPTAQKDDRKIDATLTSKVGSLGKVVVRLFDETDAGQRIKREHNVRFEAAPLRALSFVGGYQRGDATSGTQSAMTFGQMLWKVAKPLQPWAKQSAQTGILSGTDRYGLRSTIGWARVPDSGVELRLTSRSNMPDGTPSTHVFGFQTMLGDSAYVKVSLQNNPTEIKDNVEQVLPAGRNLMEMGLRIGKKTSVLARSLRERDGVTHQEAETQLFALRTQPLRGVGLAAGYQRVGGSQPATFSFTSLNWKARPLAPWAQAAATATLFSDADKYGWRRPPDWANGQGGLTLEVLSRGSQSTPGLLTYLASFQTMLGRSACLKLAAQQNTFDANGALCPVRRSMVELGAKAWGKWTIIGRTLLEENQQTGLASQSHMLGLRSALSAHERLETMISIDNQSGPGAVSGRSVGLLYSRELAADHMLSLKATFTDNQSGGSNDLRWDLAYHKNI